MSAAALLTSTIVTMFGLAGLAFLGMTANLQGRYENMGENDGS